MTTGNTGMVWEMGPYGGTQYGKWHNRQWSGTDAITPTTIRSSYDLVVTKLRQVSEKRDKLGATMTRLRLELQEERQRRTDALRVGGRLSPHVKTASARIKAIKESLTSLGADRKAGRVERDNLRKQRAGLAAQLRVAKLRKRALPPQNYWVYYQRETAPGLTYWGGTFAKSYLSYFPSLPATPLNNAGERFKLINKLREKVYGSGFNPFVFAGEGRQTIRMIGDAARDLSLALRAAKRLDAAAFVRAVRGSADEKRVRQAFSADVASRHLMVMYGIRPLLGDMEEGAKFIAQAVNGRDPTGQRVSVRINYTRDGYMPDRQGTAWWTRRRIVVKHQLICYVTDTKNGFLPSLEDLASVAWELMPWSFVIDWLLPVGKYIDALRLKNDVKGTWVETVTQHAYYLDGKTWDALGTNIWSMLPIEPSFYELYQTRTVTKDLVLPSLRDIASSLKSKDVLNWQRTSNLMALAVQDARRYRP